MSLVEFNSWVAFYKDFPFDDYNRFHRPAALAGSDLKFKSIDDALEWLQAPQKHSDLSDVDLSILRALGGKKK